jgi:3-hydroxyisobutyrate dehydrogenase
VEALNFAVQAGVTQASSVRDAASEVDIVVSMLPVGANVRAVMLEDGVLAAAAAGTLLIDCSTIDVESAQAVYQAASAAGMEMLDAPVSGGTVGADMGTLTFMCGGDESAFVRAKPILEGMGQNIVHCGAAGMGQVTKICNNMIVGITNLAVSEAMVMGETLGVDRKILHEVISTSTGSSYILKNTCPMPGPVPTAPSSNSFAPGFMAKLMLKDLRLSQAAAQSANATTPLGAVATAIYAAHVNNGHGDLDSSSIIKMIDPSI